MHTENFVHAPPLRARGARLGLGGSLRFGVVLSRSPRTIDGFTSVFHRPSSCIIAFTRSGQAHFVARKGINARTMVSALADR